MPYCPNPQCPPRTRTGRPAEYRPGVTHCADCGTELVADDPTPQHTREPRPALPAALKRRLLATLGICAIVYGASWLPNPLLDPEGVAELTAQGGISRRHLGPMGLGITPLLVGFVLVELFALLVPALRRRRLSDQKLRTGLTRAAVVVGGLWALASGISQALWMESLGHYAGGGYGPSLVVDYGWAFRLATGFLMATGTGLFALAAWGIDRHGLGRGYAVLLLAGVAFELPAALELVWRAISVGSYSLLDVALMGVVLGVAAAALEFFFRRGDRVVGRAPVRLPVCGTFPLELAMLIGMLPAALSMFLWAPWLDEFGRYMVPGSLEWLGLQAAMIAVWLVPISTMFHWRRRSLLRSPDYARFWLAARAYSGLLLIGLAGADYLMYAGGPISLGLLWPGSLTLIIVYALGSDLWTEIAARWRAPGGADLKAVEVHQDVSDALASAKVYAAGQPDKPITVTGLRYRSLTYFFGPYVPLVLLGTPDTQRREVFSGGEVIEDAELAKQFE